MSPFLLHSKTHFARAKNDLRKALIAAGLVLPENFNSANCVAFMLGHENFDAHNRAVNKAVSEGREPPSRDEEISHDERKARFGFQTKRLGQFLEKHNLQMENLRAFVERLQITAGHRHHPPLNADDIAADRKDGFFVSALELVQDLKRTAQLPSKAQLNTIRRGVLCALQSEEFPAKLLPIEVGELAVALANHMPGPSLDAALELFDLLVEVCFWPGGAHAAQVLLKRFDKDGEGSTLKRAIELTAMVDGALAAGEPVFQTATGWIDFYLTKAALLERRGAPGDTEIMFSCWREAGGWGSPQGMTEYGRYCERTGRRMDLSEALPPLPQSAVDSINAWMFAPEEEPAPCEPSKGAA